MAVVGPPSRCFVSYAHETEGPLATTHLAAVTALVEDLRRNGVDARFDRDVHGTPPTGWPAWMEANVRDAEFVLIIATETWHRRYSLEESPGRGLGATWEGQLVRQLLYESVGNNAKFAAVVFQPADSRFIPAPLRAHTVYVYPTEREDLLRWLTGQPKYRPVPVGSVPRLTREPSSVIAPADSAAQREPHRLSSEACPPPPDRPRLERFYGRESELELLQDWVTGGQTRVVMVRGLAGVGKSSLVSKFLIEGAAGHFDLICWKSLKDAPTAAELLLEILSHDGTSHPLSPTSSQRQLLARFHAYLRSRRCLVVLDNLESVVDSDGRFRPGYEDYARLLQTLAQAEHDSCIVVTSRETPLFSPPLIGRREAWRELELSGLKAQATRDFLANLEGLFGDQASFSKLAETLDGHPLFLELLAGRIRDYPFHGDVDAYLLQGHTPLISDVRQLLDWHWERLSAEQQAVLYWLAISREPTPLDELVAGLLTGATGGQLLDTLQSLRRRLPIGTSEAGYALQPVLVEYVTAHFVQGVTQAVQLVGQTTLDYVTDKLVRGTVDEILRNKAEVLRTHPIVKAVSRQHVVRAQFRLIVRPILDGLELHFGDQAALDRVLAQLLDYARARPQAAGYLAGNVINLLVERSAVVEGWNFSQLPVWQAYLQSCALRRVDFQQSEFRQCAFRQTFGTLMSVAFDPTDTLVLAGTGDGSVLAWKLANREPVTNLRGHTNWLRQVSFSADGHSVLTCADDSSIRIWNWPSGDCRQVLQGHSGWVLALAERGKDGLVASASADGSIRLWRPEQADPLVRTISGVGRVWSLAFDSRGTSLVFGCDDGVLRLWHIEGERAWREVSSHAGVVYSLHRCPRTGVLASGGGEGVVRVWDLSAGTCLATLSASTKPIRAVRFSPDGEILLAAGDDGEARLWDWRKGHCLRVLRGHNNWIRSAEFTASGDLIATGGDDQTLRIWDAASARCLQTVHGYVNGVWAVRASPFKGQIMTGTEDGLVRLWNSDSGTACLELPGHSSRVLAVDLGPDGQRAVSGGDDAEVRLWDLAEGKCRAVLRGHRKKVWSVAYSPRGDAVASAGEDSVLRIWDAETGELRHELQGHTDWVLSVAVDRAGKRVASCGDDGTIRICALTSGKCERVLRGHEGRVWDVAFWPGDDGVLVSAGEDRTVRVWRPWDDDGGLVLRGHDSWVRALACSPTGPLVASGDEESEIRVWSLETGEQVAILSAETQGRIRGLAFSHDGSMIYSAGEAGSVRIWRIDTASIVGTLRPPRPYEGALIAGCRGLSEVQRATLLALGATDEPTDPGSGGRAGISKKAPRGADGTRKESAQMARARVQQLQGHVNDLLRLQGEYEAILVASQDPKERMRAEREVAKIRVQLIEHQDELASFDGFPPADISVSGRVELASKADIDAVGERVLEGQRSLLRDLSASIEENSARVVRTLGDLIEQGALSPADQYALSTTLDATAREVVDLPTIPEIERLPVRQALQTLGDARLATAHKLKLTIPIIPSILRYETELGLAGAPRLAALLARLTGNAPGGRE